MVSDRSVPGFTLIELLVVIALLGIFAAIAAPSWLSFVERQRINQATEQIYRALRSAQSSAKTHNLPWQVTFARDPVDPQIIRYHIHSAAEDDQVFVAPEQLQSLEAWSVLTPGVTFATKPNAEGKSETSFRNEADSRWRVVFNHQGCPVYKASQMCTNSPSSKGRIGLTSVRQAEQDVAIAQRCVILSTVLGHVRRGHYHSEPDDNNYFCY